MPRPAKADEDKRKVIGARFGPQERRAIAALASQHDRSVGAEVEVLAGLFLDCDHETLALLREIADEIAVISRSGLRPGDEPGKWHKHLPTYAAVAEMLAHGPLQRHRPDAPYEDEYVEAAFKKQRDAIEEKRRLSDQLRAYGISVQPARYVPAKTAAGSALGAVLGRALTAGFDYRLTERAGIEAIPDDEIKMAALTMFDRIVELDEEEAAAAVELNDLLQPYLDAEIDGREAYRRFRRERAKEALFRNEPFSKSDLL